MKRMVDDKEIREFDERITALEQGGSGGTTYTSGEFIYVDNQEKTISLDYTDSNTIEFDTSDNRLWPKVKFGDGLNADNTGLYVNSSIARYTKVYTKDESDQKFVKITTEFDDEDNPEYFKFKAPISYNDSLQLIASQDDNNHPCDSDITLFPSRVIIGSYDYNHGPDDDTYIGELEVTDSGVTLKAEYGSAKRYLKVTTSDISYSTDGSTYESIIPTQYHAGSNITFTPHSGGNGFDINASVTSLLSTYTLGLGANGYNFFLATITAESGLEGTYTGNDAWTFITKYARYVSWYYENSSDTSGDNHKMCTIANPGQTIVFYLADGNSKVTSIPGQYAVLTVTKTN